MSPAPERLPRPITEIAAELGASPGEVEPFGRLKAKLSLRLLDRLREAPDGRLVLVTAVTPTPAGEGKTTTTIGLSQGLRRLGVRAVAALREPSLGPVFGMKGGATGGSRSTLVPAEEINLHFTGDLHAVAAANNLLAALIDNHLHFDNEPHLDPRSVTWRRCLDMNDRALRGVVTGLGGRSEGVPRETGFEITAASEVMAVLALAASHEDLTARLDRIVVGAARDGRYVTAAELGAGGAMAALLQDALLPNLVQTGEGTPALVHCGPFGNIAHGCSSVLATRMALKLGEVCVTEAGFGADLGAEKFLDIKCRQAGLSPGAAVLVATVRALKLHGGARLKELEQENIAALEAGFANLERHARTLRRFGLPVVVSINRFASDTQAELDRLRELCGAAELPAAVAEIWQRGGEGAEEVARLLLEALREPAKVHLLYPDELPLREKIECLARRVYRAGQVRFLPPAERRLAELQERGYGTLPVCVAKTQYSFSDDPTLLGAPQGHTFTVRDVKLCAGAGFVVVYSGTIMTMPGLPRTPAAAAIRLTPEGEIEGLR